MKKKLLCGILASAMAFSVLAGCGGNSEGCLLYTSIGYQFRNFIYLLMYYQTSPGKNVHFPFIYLPHLLN